MKLAMIFGVTASLVTADMAAAATICRAGPPGAAGILVDASTGAPVLSAVGKQIPCNLPQAQKFGAQERSFVAQVGGEVPAAEGLGGLGATAMVVGAAGVGLGIAAATGGLGGSGGKGGCKLVPISGGAVCL